MPDESSAPSLNAKERVQVFGSLKASKYSNPKSFVNLLLPPQGIGEGWGGVKKLRLLQELLYTLLKADKKLSNKHKEKLEQVKEASPLVGIMHSLKS